MKQKIIRYFEAIIFINIFSKIHVTFGFTISFLSCKFTFLLNEESFKAFFKIKYLSVVNFESPCLFQYVFVLFSLLEKNSQVDHFWSELLYLCILKILLQILLICYFFFFFFIFFYCSGFCHTLIWNSHGFTCVPHPNPPSPLPLHPIPLGLPSAPGPVGLMHPTWAGDLFHPR